MPDAARLVAALFLGLLAFVVSRQIMPLMPERIDFGYFIWVNMGIGLICGWVIMGSRAGDGLTAAINNGMTGVAALVFWGLFVQGSYAMFRQALRNRYDGPFEAISAIFRIGLDYGAVLLVPKITASLVIGAVLAGLASEYAKRQWR